MKRINAKRLLALWMLVLLTALSVSAAFAESASAAQPETGEKMVLIQLSSNALSGNVWTFTQSGTGTVSECPLDDYEAWRQKVLKNTRTEPGTVIIEDNIIPGCTPLAFKGEKEGLATLKFIYAPEKKNAKPECAQTVKLKVYADKTVSIISSEAVWGKDITAKPTAFTVDEFVYLKDFTIAQDKLLIKPFRCPSYGDIVNTLGKPLADSYTSALWRSLEYDFGTVSLQYDSGDSLSAVWFDIRNDTLPGPRGIYVGDSYEQVLGSFKNNLKTTPKTSKKDITLYNTKKQRGVITYDNATGGTLAPQSIYFWHGNGSMISCSVKFLIEDGFVSDILWRIDPRA